MLYMDARRMGCTVCGPAVRHGTIGERYGTPGMAPGYAVQSCTGPVPVGDTSVAATRDCMVRKSPTPPALISLPHVRRTSLHAAYALHISPPARYRILSEID